MIEPKNIEIDGLEFYSQPLKVLKAIRLDKQICSLILPALGSLDLEKLSMDTDLKGLDLSTLMTGISKALETMDGDVFENFLKELFQNTRYIGKGSTPEELNDEVINKIFQGKLFLIYKLAFEVMKYNKFTPFELVGDGKVMEAINISVNPKRKPKTLGKKSGKSASLLDN